MKYQLVDLYGGINKTKEDKIELYEFKIHNYPAKIEYNGKNKFGPIKYSDNKCGEIIFNGIDKFDNDKLINSCDIIDSSENDSSDFLNIDIKKNSIIDILYTIYKSTNPKANNRIDIYKHSEHYRNHHKYLNEIVKLIITRYNEKNGLDNKYRQYYEIEEGKYDFETGYIYQYDNPNCKYIIIGDIHGGFHTFFRLILRWYKMGIIKNLNTFEIAENKCIIFLGDILDRGIYAPEIYYILFTMIYHDLDNYMNNKPRIIYNRGNHETFEQSTGLFGSANHFLTPNMHKNLLVALYNFPCAVILNKKYWLCHGGFIYKKDEDYNRIIMDIKNNKQYIKVPIIQCQNILWSDFNLDVEDGGINYDRGGIAHYYGENSIKEFLFDSELKFIIRGHQDNYNNSWLLHKDGTKFMNNMVFLNEICSNGDFGDKGDVNKNPNVDKRYIGIIYPLIIYNTKGNTLPVMTISTNTAFSRSLNRDSFIILKSYIDKPKNIIDIICDLL